MLCSSSLMCRSALTILASWPDFRVSFEYPTFLMTSATLGDVAMVAVAPCHDPQSPSLSQSGTLSMGLFSLVIPISMNMCSRLIIPRIPHSCLPSCLWPLFVRFSCTQFGHQLL